MSTDKRSFRAAYPLGFLARTAATSAIACALGLLLLRWVFHRDLGEEYGPAVYTLRSLAEFLAPTLVFCLLSVLLVASAAVFAVALFASHKVAGPLFRLQRVAGFLARRTLVGRIHLRTGDHGKALANEINSWVSLRKDRLDALRLRLQAMEDALDTAKRALGEGKRQDASRALDELQTIAQGSS